MGFRLVLTSISLLFVSACAIRTDLGYGPKVERMAVSSGTEGRVAVAKFVDDRSDRGNQVGRVHNLYGMPLNVIEANQDPVVWVTDGFARTLAGEGFTVEKVESAASAGNLPTLTGSVKSVFVRTFLGGTGSVEVDLAIERGGLRLFSTHCEGGKAMLNWASAPSEFRNTLAAALDETVEGCLPKIVPVLKQYAVR